MNAFLGILNSYNNSQPDTGLRRGKLAVLQINMGNVCNQHCQHCHVNARPEGTEVMSRAVIDDIIDFLASHPGMVLDVTGGAPELNPDFQYFIERARPFVAELIVRSNLTVFFEPNKEYLPKLFAANGVHLMASFPCFLEKNVDAQRGTGTFVKSLRALRLLNKRGYGKDEHLQLDLVYNPLGSFLPPQQGVLEEEYKNVLAKDYDITFNRLITITNVPINRFRSTLEARGEYTTYLTRLKDNFNPQVIGSLMCKTFLSAGYDGKLYDCDFNQALGWELKDEKGEPLTIGKLLIGSLTGREIMVGEHCFSCTAGAGSSCRGALGGNIQKSHSAAG